MVTYIDEWRRKFPSCMVVKGLSNAANLQMCESMCFKSVFQRQVFAKTILFQMAEYAK